ncbi:MAG TPA: acyltransferase [Gammaproteobacteria bacterium]|jgi:maltose O-acetyltransferase|nr:acyltransferase [Gammaproteobacteria bacterium]
MLNIAQEIIGFLIHAFLQYSSKCRSRYLERRYRKSGLNIKTNGPGRISGLEGLQIGENVHIGEGYHIDARGKVSIGDNVHISRNVVIYSTSHNFDGERVPYDSGLRKKSVVIGDNVWLGMNVIVLPGAEIGEGAIVGAGAVVAGEVAPCSINVAIKAKEIKFRDKDIYQKNIMSNRFGGANGEEL